jgi:hypothetical protein
MESTDFTICHMRANCRTGLTSRLVFPRRPQSSGRAPSTITTQLRFRTALLGEVRAPCSPQSRIATPGFPESAPPRSEQTSFLTGRARIQITLKPEMRRDSTQQAGLGVQYFKVGSGRAHVAPASKRNHDDRRLRRKSRCYMATNQYAVEIAGVDLAGQNHVCAVFNSTCRS